MSAHFGALLKHNNTDFFIMFLSQLHQTTGCRESGRSRTDNYNVDFHGLAFYGDRILSHLLLPFVNPNRRRLTGRSDTWKPLMGKILL